MKKSARLAAEAYSENVTVNKLFTEVMKLDDSGVEKSNFSVALWEEILCFGTLQDLFININFLKCRF